MRFDRQSFLVGSRWGEPIGRERFEVVSPVTEEVVGSLPVAAPVDVDRRPPGVERGWFYEPTVLAGVDNSMRIAREEVFGPVTCVIAHDGDEDAIAIANDSDFGLHGAVFTADPARAVSIDGRVAASLAKR